MSKILVTGGAGYIGSHMCVALLEAGYEVVVVDDLSNSSARALQAVERVTGRQITFMEADIRDRERLTSLFSEHRFQAVVHFAGRKAVGESVQKPLLYYDNNVIGTLRLLEAMAAFDVKQIVFSSSATVYGIPRQMPIAEDHPTAPINPYGQTKLHIEHMLHDLHTADSEWRISILRYFNPVGAHGSGELGEDPTDTPNNLMPYVAQVAVGMRPHVNVFGDDYETPDGTGIRDYIHVMDLVEGHICALRMQERAPGVHTHNLGTGRGYSVLEVIRAFESASARSIAYRVIGRRPGDAAQSFADPCRANSELNWQARHDLSRMCEDAWRWQTSHPNGFRG